MEEDTRDLIPLTVDVWAALLGGGLAARTMNEIAPFEEIRPQLVVDRMGALGTFVDGPDQVFLLSEPPEVLSDPVIVSVSKRDLTEVERKNFVVPGSAIEGLGRVLLGGKADGDGTLSVVSLDGNVQQNSLRVTKFDRQLMVYSEVAGDIPEVQEPSAHLQFSLSGRARARLQRAAFAGDGLFASDFQDGRLYRFDSQTMALEGMYRIGRPLQPDRTKPLPRDPASSDWSFRVDASTGGVSPLAFFDGGLWASRTVYADESVAVIQTSRSQSEPRILRLNGGFVWSPPMYTDVIPRVRDLVPSDSYLWVTGMEEVSLGRRGLIRLGDARLGRLIGCEGELELVPLRVRSQPEGAWRTVPRTIVNAIAPWREHLYIEVTQLTHGPEIQARSYLGVADERTGLVETVVDLTRFRADWPIVRDMVANEAGVWLWMAGARRAPSSGSIFLIGYDQFKPGVIADALDLD